MQPHRPRKRFGQHFLHDAAIIRRIVQAINPCHSDHVVEIGPGRGALTAALLEQGIRLDVIELDRDLIPILKQLDDAAQRLTIYQADALQFDFASLVRDDSHPLRITGNLPYNISTPLLFHLLDYAAMIRDMHFMLQKEVVERTAARPGSGAYGRLSVMIQYRCRVEDLFHIGPGAFTPPPKVDSAFVRLIPHAVPPHPAVDEKHFATLVKQAFTYRRKTLRNALKGLADTTALSAAGIDPDQRPETVSVEQYAILSNRLCEGTALSQP